MRRIARGAQRVAHSDDNTRGRSTHFSFGEVVEKFKQGASRVDEYSDVLVRVEVKSEPLTLPCKQGQGLGFLVAATVIDKGKLQRFARAIAGLVATIGPIMLAWGVTQIADLDHNCALSKQQEVAIKGIVDTFGMEKGCGLNISVTVGAKGSVINGH